MVYISLKYMLIVHPKDQGASQAEKNASDHPHEKKISNRR